MTIFLVVSLCLLTVCTVTGMLAPFALAAGNRAVGLAALTLIIAAWAVFVLIASAVRL